MTAIARSHSRRSPTLGDVQRPVREPLAAVGDELQRIVTADLPVIDEVNGHLLLMKGKMFRPTLAHHASSVAGAPDGRAVT